MGRRLERESALHRVIQVSRVVQPITYEGRTRNKLYYRAECPIKGIWEEGKTPGEAIGKLMLSYANLFGLTIEQGE